MSIRKAIEKRQKKQKHFSWNGVEILVKDNFTKPDFSLKLVLQKIKEKIPRYLLSNLDIIYVGEFSFLKKREVQAAYENSSIFVTNEQEDEDDMAEDIVHEIAHSLEEIYKGEIYGDGLIKKEFTQKRAQLFSILNSENLKPDLEKFFDTKYNKDLDDYFYKEVGYPALDMLSNNIFYSPYGATSLREYFANGFEAFFYFEDVNFLKKNSPKLYEKMLFLLETGENR